MKLHPTQSVVAQDNHDFRVVCCGRQWGKTTLSVLEMVACAYSASGKDIAYFATTYDQARNIAWQMLKDYSRSAWAKHPNESRLELYLKTQDNGTSRITLRGFENIETARGQQFDLLVIDEVAYMHNWRYAWQAILEPTLAFRKGKALFISTPQGFNHFYDLYMGGQRKDGHWKSWRFPSSDNPYLPKDRIERAKKDSTIEYFESEWMAEFRTAVGLAHKQWNRDIHIIEQFDIPSEWQRARGFDYGSAHPVASSRVAIDNDGNWFVERSYKVGGRVTIKDHATAILSQDFNFGFMPCWGDPSGAVWHTEFAQYDLNIQPAVREAKQSQKGWVEICVEKINEKLKPRPGRIVKLPNGKTIENAPYLFVLNTQENQAFISEIEKLKWKKTTTTGEIVPLLDETDDPDGHYDLMAALRYLVVSYQGQEEEYQPPADDISKKNWRFE